MKNRWTSADRQAFADGNRLRASTIQGRRHAGPDAGEWADWTDDEELIVNSVLSAVNDGI